MGQQLLKLNILKDRVTFIPLNKINPFVLHQAKLDAAKKVDGKGGGRRRVAMAVRKLICGFEIYSSVFCTRINFVFFFYSGHTVL